MGHEAATRAPIIQPYSNPPRTAVQLIRIRTSSRVSCPTRGGNTPKKDHEIQPFANLSRTAVQSIRMSTSERVPHPTQGINTPPKDYTIQPSPRPNSLHIFTTSRDGSDASARLERLRVSLWVVSGRRSPRLPRRREARESEPSIPRPPSPSCRFAKAEVPDKYLAKHVRWPRTPSHQRPAVSGERDGVEPRESP